MKFNRRQKKALRRIGIAAALFLVLPRSIPPRPASSNIVGL